MGTKTITICDSCGQEIKQAQDGYRLVLKTDTFLNSVELDYLREEFIFCPSCTRDIKWSLKTIAEALRNENA